MNLSGRCIFGLFGSLGSGLLRLLRTPIRRGERQAISLVILFHALLLLASKLSNKQYSAWIYKLSNQSGFSFMQGDEVTL
jgi:hypothetical protein